MRFLRDSKIPYFRFLTMIMQLSVGEMPKKSLNYERRFYQYPCTTRQVEEECSRVEDIYPSNG